LKYISQGYNVISIYCLIIIIQVFFHNFCEHLYNNIKNYNGDNTLPCFTTVLYHSVWHLYVTIFISRKVVVAFSISKKVIINYHLFSASFFLIFFYYLFTWCEN
jgi:hypothetical protein